MTREAMVDLETLDVNPAACIISIGAVIINPYAPEFAVLNSYYRVLHIDGQDRDIAEDTLCFWMKQSDEARSVFKAEDKIYLHDMLPEFQDFLKLEPIDKIWSKPSYFDLAILTHAYEQYSEEVPWQHRQGKCFRTLCDENPDVPMPIMEGGVKHNALDDALLQARWLHAIRKRQAMIADSDAGKVLAAAFAKPRF